MGCPLALSKGHDNYFVHKIDPFVVDSATNRVVYEGQKPLGLFNELIELYASEDDWIFYAPSGVGMYVCMCIPFKITVPKCLGYS